MQKARRFAAASETSKTKRTVRILEPPDHEAIRIVHEPQVNPEIINKIEKLEGMIRSIQRDVKTPPKSQQAQTKTLGTSNQTATTPHLNNRQENRQRSQQLNNHQRSVSLDRQYGRPFTGHRPPTPTNYDAPRQWTNSQPPPGRPRGRCYVCGTPGCHTNLHNQHQQHQPQQSMGTGNSNPSRCFVYNRPGCHSRHRVVQGRPNMSPGSHFRPSNQGNDQGTRVPGNRTPNQPARPRSH